MPKRAPGTVTRQIDDCVWNTETGAYTFVLECGHRAPTGYTAPPRQIPLVAECGTCTADMIKAAKAQKQARKAGKTNT